MRPLPACASPILRYFTKHHRLPVTLVERNRYWREPSCHVSGSYIILSLLLIREDERVVASFLGAHMYTRDVNAAIS